MAVNERPREDFTDIERRTEINLLRDLKDAQKFGDVYPKRLQEAEQNLNELYEMVKYRRRMGL
jgi:hypothetical protein